MHYTVECIMYSSVVLNSVHGESQPCRFSSRLTCLEVSSSPEDPDELDQVCLSRVGGKIIEGCETVFGTTGIVCNLGCN